MSVKGKVAGVLLAALVLPASTAFAAGNGYGPGGPAVMQPGYGFASVLAARSMSAKGGTIVAHHGHDLIVVSVPQGAFGKVTQVSVARAIPGLVRKVVSFHYSVDLAYGVSFKGSALKKPVTITFASKTIPANAIVEEVIGKKVYRVKAIVHRGKAEVWVKGNESLVIISPTAQYEKALAHAKKETKKTLVAPRKKK